MKPYVFPFLAVLLVCCSKEQEKRPPAKVHYEVGAPYQVGEEWYYPEENFAYKSTGIAVISHNRKGTVTADGEYYDPKAMTGAHPTLQLPAIVKVRNLDNGREITIRLNDRTSSLPARLLELTPQAASLLGVSASSPAKIEIVEDESQSQNLAFQMPDGPQTQMKVEKDPVNTIKVEDLNGSAPVVTPAASQGKGIPEKMADLSAGQSVTLPDLPVTYQQGAATGGQLWIDAGTFTSPIYARRLAARINGTLVDAYEGGRRIIHVRTGPYQSVNSVDSDLEYLLKSGIKGARIIVE